MDKHKALIEKVAQAICENSGGTWRKGEYPIASGKNFEVEHHDLDKFNNHWRYAATAALNAAYEALKEPSEEMVTAAMHALDTPFFADIEKGYRAMISSSPLGKGE